MLTINIDEAQADLSRLVEQAANGEPFVIAREGKPLVMVSAVDPTVSAHTRRVGFLKGRVQVPEDFDSMGRAEIERMFGE